MKNVLFNGYSPFYNIGNSNLMNSKKYWNVFKDNGKQNQSINLFKKNFRSKIPMLYQRNNFIKNEQHKKGRNDTNEENLISCPNIKNTMLY